MNLEHFINLYLINQSQLKNKKLFLRFLKYHLLLLIWKRNKLKLGKIAFIFKKTYLTSFIYFEEITIRYVNQDNTEEDEFSFEAWTEYFSWHWDWVHIISLFFMLKIVFNSIKLWIIISFIDPWRWIFFKPIYYDYFLKIFIENIYFIPKFGLFRKWLVYNQCFIDTLIDLCSLFDIFF